MVELCRLVSPTPMYGGIESLGVQPIAPTETSQT
jgi:hypothetical protein